MNIKDLLQLLDVRNLSVADVRKEHPKLFNAIAAEAREAMRARVLEALGEIGEDLRRKIEKIDLGDVPPEKVVDRIREALGRMKIPSDRLAPILERLQDLAALISVAGTDDDNRPIGDRPDVVSILGKAQLLQIASIAKLPPSIVNTLGSDVPDPSALHDATLRKLVDEKKLDAQQARSIGLAAAIYQLTDERPGLAAAIQETATSALGRPPASPRDLARLRQSDWVAALDRAKIDLPPGTTVGELASSLAARFAALHPDVAFVSRLPQVDPGRAGTSVNALDALLQKNPDALTRDFSALDTTGLSGARLEEVATAHGELRRMDRMYPGLRIAEMVQDPERTPQQKADILTRRTTWIGEVQSRLADVEDSLFHLDLSNGSADLERLQLAGIGDGVEQRMVLSTLRAYQRTWAITRDPQAAQELLEAGFSSATSIAKRTLAEFANTVGLPKAERYWRDARSLLMDGSVTLGSVIDVVADLFDDLGVGNVQPDVRDYLRRLDGYETLFGSLSFCTCEHCQSILSPAAYFVDLMQFVREHIEPQFGGNATHPLQLRTRRPDLWTLELTCANTNDRIATLDIVNEILENFIALRGGFSGSLTDRAAVQDQVYRQTLLGAVDSFAQPFHLPLTRVDLFLRKLASSRAEVARALGAQAAVAQAELRLSADEWQRIVTPRTTLTSLNDVYDVQFTAAGTGVAAIDAQEVVRATGLEREALGAIIGTSFVRAGGASVSIGAERRDNESVQNDIERIHGMTVDVLDRIHRFARLWRHLSWTVEELDRVLTALGQTTLDASGLTLIATVHEIQWRLGLRPDEAVALAGPIPRTPPGRSIFDDVFNAPGTTRSFPQDATHFVHPAFRITTAIPSDAALPQLLGALGLDLHSFARIIEWLAPHLGSNIANTARLDINAPVEDDRFFLLTALNLEVLHRHARLAKLLRVSVDELFQLIALAGVADGAVSTAHDVLALLDLQEWLRSSGMRLDDVLVATGRSPTDSTRYLDPDAVAAQLVARTADTLSFRDTLFSATLGTTEQASREIIAANPTLFESVGAEDWRLAAGVDLANATIVILPSATIPVAPDSSRLVTGDEVRAVLRVYEPATVLAAALAATFDVDAAKVDALARIAGGSLAAPPVVLAFRGDGPIAPLRNLVAAMRSFAVALAAPEWNAAAIDFVRQNPARFGLSLPAISPAAVRALSVYVRLVRRRIGSGPDAVAVDPADIRAALAAFDSTTMTLPAPAIGTVARSLGVSAGLIAGLRGKFGPVANAAFALDAFDRAAQLASRLLLDGESFAAILSNDYARLSAAAEALAGSIRASYPDEAERARQLAAVEEPLREQKRDALVAWMLHSIDPKLFRTSSELYAYFLIDVEAGGCSTTSRVVSATSTGQLFIHRVMINLEQTAEGAPNPIHLRMPEEAAAEWTWRRNYRVWEANRKVFLWPENYIEPDLRDDKTPLFRELESELLQTDLTDQDVLDAYTKYIRGFEELATLTIAGAYHDVQTRPNAGDVLHLFGVSTTDPPVFYYRTCENLRASASDPARVAVWTPWRKIDVQISGRRISPIVYRGRLHVFWCDYKTRPINEVTGGTSRFVGYRHNMSIRFTTLRPDGAWTPPQPINIPPFSERGSPAPGAINDLLFNGRPLLARNAHNEPHDDYTLRSPNWDWLWLEKGRIGRGNEVLAIRFRDFLSGGYVDLFRRNIVLGPGDVVPAIKPQLLAARGSGELYRGIPTNWGQQPPLVIYPLLWGAAATANLIIDERRLDVIDLDHPFVRPTIVPGSYSEHVANVRAGTEFLAIPGSVTDAILQVGPDILLIQGSVAAGRDVMRRIGTTLADQVAFRLFVGGVDGLLDIDTQLALQEAAAPISLVGLRIDDRTNSGRLDFTGPYGVYYRELFFHIPFLIANALNGRGKFAAAQRWYEYIFDPASTEVIAVPSNLPAQERARRLLDRVWRYREFRGLDVSRLRQVLTDPTALAAYRKDPFNPHAIARLRLSAYQKAIVMKYVDNLLDWGDHLFTQFTMESVGEALMLYIMASDILGPRPARLGSCGEGTVQPKTYENIRSEIGDGEEILVEIETWLYGRGVTERPRPREPRFGMDPGVTATLRERIPLFTVESQPAATNIAPAALRQIAVAGSEPLALETAVSRTDPAERPPMFSGMTYKESRIGTWGPPLGASTTAAGDNLAFLDDHRGRFRVTDWAGRFGWSIIRQVSPIFCIPMNGDLLAYWTRVEDRLYKIRHCMDMTGQKRELALFAPEIDPRLLVRMRAAGLSLEDVLGGTTGDLPPYRFLFLLDRAKAFAASLSSFGAALLATLEKKDGEELGRLRLVHQQNLSRMTTQLRRWDVRVAEESLAALERQRDAAEYRRAWNQGLYDQNRTPAEGLQTIARHTASVVYGAEALTQLSRAIVALIPSVGSPFSMNWGGKELTGSAAGFAGMAKALAKASEAVAASTGLEAGFDRRREGWQHQAQLAAHDTRNLDRQIEAARIRLEIAQRSLETHERSIEQLDEVLELTDGKFTNLGRYTFLATQLRRLYRDSYQNALALARLAEQAFRFERGDETSPGLAQTYWDAPNAGLLAGEQLLADLQNLERRFLETNYRSLEVDQAFALSQIAPAALLDLRETGECRFRITELFFDLFYPGHYKRRIRAVRLTIPSITGPYVNVSATLTLDKSWMRVSPAVGAALIDVPPRRSVSVATSTAQNDAGVFELSFRDERYMPFEGAGAISEWVLTLPKTFRQFDYQTINDVILSVSYTAEQDGALRGRVEDDNAAIDQSIRKFLTNNSVGRVFSLRQDFPGAFTRLLHSPAGTEVQIEITDRHFPLGVGGRPISVTRSALVVRSAQGVAANTLQVSVDGTAVSGFTADATLGNLPARPLPAPFNANVRSTHRMTIDDAAAFAPATLPPGDVSAVDADKLLDLLLYIEYRLT